MRTTLFSIAALSALTLLATACSQDEPAGTAASAATSALTVESVAIASGEPATRAAVLPTPVTSGTIMVGVRDGNGYKAQGPLAYTYSGGKWTCSAADIKVGFNAASLYGYILGGHSENADGTIGMTTRDYADTTDLLYATSGGENVCATHPYAGFVLKHAYARVKVNLTLDSSLPAATHSTLDAVSLDATGLYASASLKPDDDTLVVGTPLSQPLWSPNAAITSLAGRKFTGDKLVVPAATLSDAKLTVTVSGTRWPVDLSTALTALQMGKIYTINVTLKKYSLLITKVEVEEWTDGGTHNSDMEIQGD